MSEFSSAFTAHNIRLDDGRLTMPDEPFEFNQQPVLHAAIRVLRMVYPNSFIGKRIADLGCLEGGYAVEFARMGFESVGIEVRPSNFANCTYVKERVDLPKLSFVNDDVWNIERCGRFDAVFCNGLLYHLDRPAEFLRILSRVCADVVIINTHVASASGTHGQPPEAFTTHDGVRGTWYNEFNPEQAARLDMMKWSSWSNHKSFWPTRGWLAQMTRDAGFDLVFEQFDWLPSAGIAESMETGYYAQDSRVMFVGMKSERRAIPR